MLAVQRCTFWLGWPKWENTICFLPTTGMYCPHEMGLVALQCICLPLNLKCLPAFFKISEKQSKSCNLGYFDIADTFIGASLLTDISL